MMKSWTLVIEERATHVRDRSANRLEMIGVSRAVSWLSFLDSNVTDSAEDAGRAHQFNLRHCSKDEKRVSYLA